MRMKIALQRILGLVALASTSAIAGCAVDSPDLVDDPGADGEDIGQRSDALTTSTVSINPPAGLIQSTGNLYWTSNSFSEFGGYSARVYRAAKTNTPGSEIVLYQESSGSPVRFGDITYALIGSTWYGYFVANYGSQSMIKRVPLTGGAALTLAVSPAFINGTGKVIDTDGSRLYWADAGGVRSISMSGGAVTTLASQANISSLGLDSSRVFYAAGSVINSVPKTGGAATWQASGLGTIRTMHVAAGSPTTLFWGELGGRIGKKIVGGAASFVYAPSGSFDALSVYFDGSRLLWTECTTPGWSTCTVFSKLGTSSPMTWSGGVAASYLQGDASNVFWGNAATFWRAKY